MQIFNFFVEYSGLENCARRNNRAPCGLRTAVSYVEHGRLELPTSTLPVSRSSQMS